MKRQRGYTLVELTVVVGIVALLVTLVTINLGSAQIKTSVSSLTTEVIAQMKEQQVRAMTGDTGGATNSLPYGIHFESDKYVLYRGSSYTPEAATNATFSLPEQMEFADILFPNGDVLFMSSSGEVSGFSAGADSVTIRHEESGDQKIIRLNKFGVIVEVTE